MRQNLIAECEPDHKLENSRDFAGEYVKSKLVATCGNCKGDRGKNRVKIPGNPTFCQDCRSALYYERI